MVVAACTVLCSVAQFLIKLGMSPGHFTPSITGLLQDYPLILGYMFYGLFTVAMVMALREGELSKLYPIIALTYVWVTLLSYWLLKEPPNLYKNVGIFIVVIGVAVLGRGDKK